MKFLSREHSLSIAVFAVLFAGTLISSALELSGEGEQKKALHDFLFEKFVESREAKFIGEGEARGLKELTILKETQEIHHGDEIALPAGAERIATFFRHFGFHGENLDQIKEVHVVPFSPDKSPPRSMQVTEFYRVQMPTIPESDEDPAPMKIRFFLKDESATCRIDNLVFYAQNPVSPEFDSIPYVDLGSDQPRVPVVVDADIEHELVIDGTSDLQRERWFRYHETPGSTDASFQRWAYERGFLPARGFLKFNPALTKGWGKDPETLKEREDKPGAADLSFFEWSDSGERLRSAIPELQGKSFTMCFNDWPEFMSVPLKGRGTPLVERFDEAAELAAAYVADQIADAGYTATWWEVKNESSVKSEWDHHFAKGLDGWGLLADFHNRTADAIHAKAPGVKVGGPSSAYMQLQVKDFELYRSQARFIEETRGHIDFFSHHFYENLGMLGAHERRDSGYSSYLLGRYEAVLDMLRAHMHQADNVLPILITETGSLQNGRRPADNWFRLMAWNAYLNKSMQRPDQIDLFIPFIFLNMSWNPYSGDAAFSPKDGLDKAWKIEDFEPSTIAHFFEFWRDFDGRRLPVSFDHDWLDVTAVHDDGQISLAVTNMGGRQLAVDLSGLVKKAGATGARQKRLNYHRGKVVFQPWHEVDAAAVPVDVNETTVIQLPLSEPLTPAEPYQLKRWFALETGVKSTGEATEFLVKIPNPNPVKSARLLVGVHRSGGITEPLTATINGTEIAIGTGDANEFSEFFAPLDADIPADLLQAENQVLIKAQEGTTVTSVQVVTLDSTQSAAANPSAGEKPKPNILWIVTDDQRADSIAAFNKMLGTSENGDSRLGKVLSPNVDRLAAMGTTFLQTYNQNPGCAPIRTLMHTGRYSHHTGVYGFEYYTPVGQAHWRPFVPHVLRDEAGYQTVAVGKLGIRALDHTVGKKVLNIPLYDTFLGYRRDFAAEGLTDWNKEKPWADGKPGSSEETFFFPDGNRLNWNEGASDDDREEIREKLDLLRLYHPGEENSDNEILGGVNSQGGEMTRDGNFIGTLLEHFDEIGKTYTDRLGREQDGPNPDKPIFAYCGFDFPHTPVLPPKEFREKFRSFKYKIPEFTEEELAAFPPQLMKLFKNAGTDHFTDEEKHQMIADYYAFCAYGDSLVGQAVDGFVSLSEKQNRPWMILYVCGDHGWRLNDHGMVAKFSHYDTDLHNPIIVASSDKAAFPDGEVVTELTTFVDIAPTFYEAAGLDTTDAAYDHLDGFDLAKVAAGDGPQREYTIAEPTWVIGPRGVIRTREWKFAMKLKPRYNPGKDMDWAIGASLEEVEPTLFDLRSDPLELKNLAFDSRHRPVVDALREKLQNILLGDGRVEVAWTREGGDEVFTGNFAPGADDGKITVPEPLKSAPKAATAKAKPKKKSAKAASGKQPNIVLVFADDISARELPVYGATVWSPPLGGNSSDPAFRAQTPVLDELAAEGCWIKHCWAATVCSPSRAMIMTGRYAHRHKWWTNNDIGEVQRENGKREKWPLYESSPLQLGHLAQQAGYGTFWTGKTQMAGDLTEFGFDEGVFTPGNLSDRDNPYTDFKHEMVKRDGGKIMINTDTGDPVDTYLQHGWYWYPHVRLMNHLSLNGKTFGWWPNTPETKKSFGPHTYGPDVELDFAFEFMERQHAEGKPFFVYHCSHLGHDAFNWLDPADPSKWPGTPVVKWDGEKYQRTEPKITGDKGDYDTHGTVTESGIHHHINYLDYHVWRYREKLEEMGIAENTVLIFCADNGTSGYGKHSPDRQKGTHVPLIIHAPGMKKHGEQDVLLNLSDFLPTFADIMGVDLPADYAIDGESFWPFVMSGKKNHRKWIYGYRGPQQLIRGRRVMKDGFDKWWNVSEVPDDLISFPQIEDWQSVSQEHRNERNLFRKVLPEYDLWAEEHDAPGTPPAETAGKK
ncbi:MAG: sulfatase-like hydrolase/transferase [Verrucomicrobiales bacterium]|nr:sulfatase-like hydrolase/transferase [Verrucomicrobiales bacterium]